MKKRKKRITPSDFILDAVIYFILIFAFVITLYPVWYVIVASFATAREVTMSGGLMLWPKEFILGGYQKVFQDPYLISGFANSVKVLIVSLPINLILTLFCGYFMASTNMMLKKIIVYMMMFTMYFSGGMIPNYLNIRSLGLMDSFWALVLPGAVSVYNCIICKTAIEAIPSSLQESAYIDGANDLQVIWKILIPLLKPTLAVLTLYYGVSHWNAWFNASIYIRTKTKLPVQNILREFLLANADQNGGGIGDTFDPYSEAIKYAAIVISTLPIMCIYPFLQKYFAKGVMIGAVKG
ncbi:MAG: carbohydrate ABC transporter permease [Lachnospiraceae bacterium]|nr:carbohydrate ABC transporter permease [Lachnospiraceae bacterium]